MLKAIFCLLKGDHSFLIVDMAEPGSGMGNLSTFGQAARP